MMITNPECKNKQTNTHTHTHTKVFDTLLNNQLMSFLLTNDILSATQYAFRPKSSTILALQTIENFIRQQISLGKYVLALYADLSKAYDTIKHELLAKKFKDEFYFSDATATFFASYFVNRQQTVHTQHAESLYKTITDGVPQGSTLSTSFFNMYINRINKAVPGARVYTFADDTIMIIIVDSLEQLEALAQIKLDLLIASFHEHNLVPNSTKTFYTFFNPTTPPNNFHLHINNNPLKHKTHTKLLGVYIENTIKYTHTIASIIQKLQPYIQSFRYANTLLTTDQMIKLYYALIYPHFIYSITLWGTTESNATYIQPLIKTHKKILRLIANCPPRTHTKPLLNKFKLLNLNNLYIHRVCTDMHPNIHNTAPPHRPDHDQQYTKI